MRASVKSLEWCNSGAAPTDPVLTAEVEHGPEGLCGLQIGYGSPKIE